jgi:hypothetical protein
LALFRRKMLRSRLSTLQPACPSLTDRLSLGLTHSVLSLANGNVEYLFGKLGGIAGTFGHEASMPQAVP